MSDDSDTDEFLFESAHLALRNNSDYLKLMKHLTSLCSQRIQVHKDIEALNLAQQKALEDPEAFVEKLKNESLNLPGPLEIPEIPEIDFSKYNVNRPIDNQDKCSASTSTSNKTPNTNFWTLDEQRRLEELLDEFPPEAVESQRFVKIAKAMGNRTPKQIASRVQKFFKKLHEANLPIPGASSQKPFRGRQYKQHLKFERPSTFFPERNIPSELLMKDDFDDDSESFASKLPTRSNSEQNSAQEKTLNLLKKIRQEKVTSSELPTKISSGFKCSSCHEILFVASRWSCKDCVNNDLCSDCLTFQLINNNCSHLHHNLQLS